MKGFALLALLLTPLAVQAAPACKTASQGEITQLFEHWNQALQSGDATQVAATYQENAVLLPTLSNQVRLTPAQRVAYFEHFLAGKPSGEIVSRTIQTGCNHALDAGVYEFTFATTGEKVQARYSYTYHWDGARWLIGSHHSSVMPQG